MIVLMCLAAVAAQGVFLVTILVLRRKKKQRKAMLEAQAAAAQAAAAAAVAAAGAEAGVAAGKGQGKKLGDDEGKPSPGDSDSAADPSEAAHGCCAPAAAASHAFDDSVRGGR